MANLISTEPVLADLMTTRLLIVAPEDTLGETAARMAELDTGSAVVAEWGKLVGILTSRDLLRAVAARTHSSEARVRDWMTREPVTAEPETTAGEALALLLAGGFHHLPVVVDGRPVGLVGLRAVARAESGID
jgi:CBS domain-containing protein